MKTSSYRILLVTIYAVFAVIGGSWNPGYQMADDHEIVTMTTQLKEGTPFGEVAKDQISESGRFRPLYRLHRCVLAWGLGLNFSAHGGYFLVLGAVALLVWFQAALVFEVSPWLAGLFSLITTIGSHGEVWWKTGNQENIGLLLMALVGYFTARLIVGQIKWRDAVIWLVLCLALTLMKESLILFAPVFGAAVVVGRWYRNDFKWSRDNNRFLPFALIVGVVALFELIYIKFYLRSTGIGYAGVDQVTLSGMVVATGELLKYHWYVLVPLLVAVGMWSRQFNGELRGQEQKMGFRIAILFFILAVFPQVYLHAQSGFGIRRYLVPVVLYFSTLTIYSLHILERARGINRKWFGAGAGVVAIFAVALLIENAGRAGRFSERGRTFVKFSETLGDLKSDSKNLLFVVDPVAHFEGSHACDVYWRATQVQSQIRVMRISKSEPGDAYTASLAESHRSSMFTDREWNPDSDFANCEAIVIFGSDLEKLFQAAPPSWFVAADWDRSERIGEFIRYSRI